MLMWHKDKRGKSIFEQFDVTKFEVIVNKIGYEIKI